MIAPIPQTHAPSGTCDPRLDLSTSGVAIAPSPIADYSIPPGQADGGKTANPQLASPDLRVERSSHPDALLRDSGAWNALACGHPFRQTQWLAPWWHHFGNARDAYFVAATDSLGELRGVLPLYRSLHSPWPVRTLAFVASGQACSDHLSVIAGHDGHRIGRLMGNWLAEKAADPDHGWDWIVLDGVSAGDGAIAGLAQGLCEAGAGLHVQSRMNTWYHAVVDTWDAYVRGLSKPNRRQIRTVTSRLEDTPGLAVGVSTSLQDLRRDLCTMIELHQRRWVEVGEAGTYADPAFRDFVHDAASSFFQAGRLRMLTARLGDQILSGEIQLVSDDGTIHCYSAGMDPDQVKFEPGKMINFETLRYAYENGIPGIDMLRGDEPYKARLGATPRPLLSVRFAAPTIRGKFQHLFWRTGFATLQWCRQQSGRTKIAVFDSIESSVKHSGEVRV